ncbi:MAG: chemotaxis-specific protein-glutamate methyltransferase CheB [Paracoccus sp. (in: a-proteobacteria)]|nr:chemotaxis-specific protein-glutamate methyltransferase CheB [Paracoccus sp. (in: a-proteobacteria)]
MTRPVRLLIVDDSATIRRLIRLRLSADPRIEVVGEAADAAEAEMLIARLRPDVLTLDVEMPGKSGLQFLAELMVSNPLPVVMLSSETQRGSAAAIEALSLGAVECLGKPQGLGGTEGFAELPGMIRAAAQARVGTSRRQAGTGAAASRFEWNGRIVLVGSSTGGVEALELLLSQMPENCPPILITQHMPESFLASFVQRLNARFAPRITLAGPRDVIEQGRVYIAPGGETHLGMAGPVARPRCDLIVGEKVSNHRPSVDVMFGSARSYAANCVAVMLTGMGHDGAAAMVDLRRAGALCLAQDQASSVVWGMPRAAYEQGGVDRLIALDRMAAEILEVTGKGAARSGYMGRAS